MEYDLQRLTTTSFQTLAGALAIRTFGAQRVQSMGEGRDGGRDVIATEPVRWPEDAGLESPVDQEGHAGSTSFDGYTVFQSKFLKRLRSERHDDAKWLWSEIRKELKAWGDTPSKRDPVPDDLVFITNVALTPVPDAGGFDWIHKRVRDYRLAVEKRASESDFAKDRERARRLRQIRRVIVWDGNQVSAMLTAYPRIWRGIRPMLAPDDILDVLEQFTESLPLEMLGPALQESARDGLVGGGLVFFGETGADDSRSERLEKIAIDLPVVDSDGSSSTALATVLSRGEDILRPSLSLRPKPRHLVLVGGPGNGKSTVTKFLVHLYRCSFYQGSVEDGTEHHGIIRRTRNAAERLSLEMPENRRWPIRIDLPEWVREWSGHEASLLRWMAQVTGGSMHAGSVTPTALGSWLRQWPSLIVLDGLDEVTEPGARAYVVRKVSEFVAWAESGDFDLLVVITTRPHGYSDEFSNEHFERLDLGDLEFDEAVRYGESAIDLRLGHIPDRASEIKRRFRHAVDTDALQNLLRTPLQVMLMTIIVEGSPRLHPDRYRLFWAYFTTVLNREGSKTGPVGELVKTNENHIIHIHQRVGLRLQCRSEAAAGSTATITIEALKDEVWRVLADAGYNPSAGEGARLLDQLATAATDRLVLLAPRPDGDLGFDVRSLQELLAGSRITTGEPDVQLQRLRLIAPRPHWRNTLLFAIGRLISEPQPHLHQRAMELLRTVDQDSDWRFGSAFPLGPLLALEVLDEGMLDTYPSMVDVGLEVALGVLAQHRPPNPAQIADALIRVVTVREGAKATIAEAFRAVLSSSDRPWATVKNLQARMKALPTARGRSDAMELSRVKAKDPGEFDGVLEPDWPTFYEVLEIAHVDGVAAWDVVFDVLPHLLDRDPRKALDRLARFVDAIHEPDVAEALNLALTYVNHDPFVVSTFRDVVLDRLLRLPIGARVAATFDE